jgi:hypothetical protein
MLAMPVCAQEESEKSSVLIDGKFYSFAFNWQHKPKGVHWSGASFSFAGLEGLDNYDVISKMGRSYSFTLNVSNFSLPLSSHFVFGTGFGFDWTRYHFKGDVALKDNSAGITEFFADTRPFRDSKLLVYYATFPLVLEYQKKIKNKTRFFMQGGVEGLLKLYSKSEAEVRIDNAIKEEYYRDLNILPVNFRVVFRTGFDNVSFFCYYQPISMFASGKGPELHPFGVGIALH